MRRIEIDQIPDSGGDDDGKLKEFIYKTFKEKDALLEKFYEQEQPSFPGARQLAPLPASDWMPPTIFFCSAIAGACGFAARFFSAFPPLHQNFIEIIIVFDCWVVGCLSIACNGSANALFFYASVVSASVAAASLVLSSENTVLYQSSNCASSARFPRIASREGGASTRDMRSS